MDDDSEVLDWGQDEENHFNGERHHRFSNSYDHKRNGDPDDVEDAVSLGGDEDDMQDFISLPSHADQTGPMIEEREAAASSSDRLASRKRDADAEPPISHPKEQTPQVQSPPPQNSPLRPLTHALPPKPIVSDSAFLSLPSTTAASPMSMARRDKERRANGVTARHAESLDPLPADWEMRHSRGSDRDAYYYNLKTHESTWDRPGASRAASPNLRGRGRPRPETVDSRPSSRRDVDVDLSMRAPERRGHPEFASNEPSLEDLSKKDLSYKDRHYRPEGEAAPEVEGQARAREEKMPTAPSRSRRDRLSLERDVERPLPSRNGSQRAAEDSRRTRRSLSVPRDDPSRRFIESDSYRAGQTYRSSDTGSAQVYASHPRDAPARRAPPSFDTRPKHADYDAAPSLPQDHFTSNQNTGRSSTLRRRSPSPPSTQRVRSGPDRRDDDSRSAVPFPSAAMQSRQSGRPGRATSPPRGWSDSRVRDRGSYAPAEIPQRRGRDVDLGPDEDNDAKRRRLDRRGDSTVSRRATADSDVFRDRERDRDSSESMSPLPSAHSDQSRQRKRLPLPSQSDRWKESSSKPVPPPALAPPAVHSPIDRRPSHAQPPPNAPSGPRSTIAREHIPVEFPPPRRLQENAPPPPRNWGRDSRNASYSSDYPARHEDAMDVDAPYPPRPPVHEDAPRPRRPTGYDGPARDEPTVRDPPPRAPRAMGARLPASVTMTASPTSSAFPRGPPPADHPPRSQRDKSPPPARNAWADDRRPPTEPSHSNRVRESDMRAAGEPERRRPPRDEHSDRHRYSERERPDYQGPKESRGPRGRLSDLPPTGPAGGRLPPDLSGPGPVRGGRGPPPPAPPDSYPSSPVDRRGPPSPVERRGPPAGGYFDSAPPKPAREYPQRTPSGPSGARGLPPPPQRQELPQQRHEPPPQRHEPASRHEPPSADDSREPSTTQSEDSGPPGRREQRTSRFGPPKAAADPAPEPPRIWIPRDAIADANYVVDGTRPPPPLPGAPPRATSGSWPRPPEQDTRPPPDARPPRQSRPSRFGPPVDDQRNRDGRVEGADPTAQSVPPPPRRSGSFSGERRPGPGFNGNAPLHAHESLPHRPHESFPPPPRPDPNAFAPPPPPHTSWNSYGAPRPRPSHGDPGTHGIEPMWHDVEANQQPAAQTAEDTSTVPAPPADLPARVSKPVKIRRPAPKASEEPAEAPGMSRRLSLLDRMSSDEQGASLQERMEEGGEWVEEGAKKRWVKKGRKGKW